MSSVEEALGSIITLFFGGWLFLTIGARTGTIEMMNFSFWGMIFILTGIISVIVLVVGLLGAISSR